MSLEIIFMGISIVINLLIAFYICRQVRVANISNHQNVMPILGLKVGTTLLSEIAGDIRFESLKSIFSERSKEMIKHPVQVLRVYVQFNIAKNINCKILKNGEDFIEFNKESAVPPKDGMVIIHEEDISEIIKKLSEEEEIEFIASFSFQSVLDGKFECKYTLRTKKYLNQQFAELEFIKYPW